MNDRTFADAFIAAYRGRHLPADALWWLAHPTEMSPSGVASPAESRDHLQAAAFSRAGDPNAHLALERLEHELAADHEATLAALAQVAASTRFNALTTRDEAPGARPQAQPQPHKIPGSADASGTEHRRTRAPWSRGRWGSWDWWGTGAITIALVVGVCFGIAFSPAPPPRALITDAGETRTTWGPAMVEVLNRPQVAEDVPTEFNLGISMIPSSFRLLAQRATQSGENPAYPVKVYVARDTNASPCLILYALALKSVGVTCTPEADLGPYGMTVSVQDAEHYVTWTWSPDGTDESQAGEVGLYAPVE
ncbi:hypothetical protein [Glaciihabitans sp. dw_435]|uniref:hypothetical protein n=1 Tax=Glaciihabitans sp. dw_435 TaxID=2720081 RepID=UPI001BD3DC7F|nr:hypothetical protein [Glaciihabitans sp. dw_435]